MGNCPKWFGGDDDDDDGDDGDDGDYAAIVVELDDLWFDSRQAIVMAML